MYKKRDSILIMLTTFIFILVIIGAAYAYFNVAQTNNSTQFTVDTNIVSIEYTDCGSNNGSNSEDNHCQLIEASLKPGDSVEKTFKVRNAGNVTANYTIYFRRLLNTFQNNELVYKLEDITNSNSPITLVNANTAVPYYTTETNNVGIVADTIPVSGTKEYKITITFKDLGDIIQNNNLTAEFLIQLGIKEYEPVNAP